MSLQRILYSIKDKSIMLVELPAENISEVLYSLRLRKIFFKKFIEEGYTLQEIEEKFNSNFEWDEDDYRVYKLNLGAMITRN